MNGTCSRCGYSGEVLLYPVSVGQVLQLCQRCYDAQMFVDREGGKSGGAGSSHPSSGENKKSNKSSLSRRKRK